MAARLRTGMLAARRLLAGRIQLALVIDTGGTAGTAGPRSRDYARSAEAFPGDRAAGQDAKAVRRTGDVATAPRAHDRADRLDVLACAANFQRKAGPMPSSSKERGRRHRAAVRPMTRAGCYKRSKLRPPPPRSGGSACTTIAAHVRGMRRRLRQFGASAARSRARAGSPAAGHISTASRVIGLSTGGVTQSKPPARRSRPARPRAARAAARLLSAASS